MEAVELQWFSRSLTFCHTARWCLIFTRHCLPVVRCISWTTATLNHWIWNITWQTSGRKCTSTVLSPPSVAWPPGILFACRTRYVHSRFFLRLCTLLLPYLIIVLYLKDSCNGISSRGHCVLHELSNIILVKSQVHLRLVFSEALLKETGVLLYRFETPFYPHL